MSVTFGRNNFHLEYSSFPTFQELQQLIFKVRTNYGSNYLGFLFWSYLFYFVCCCVIAASVFTRSILGRAMASSINVLTEEMICVQAPRRSITSGGCPLFSSTKSSQTLYLWGPRVQDILDRHTMLRTTKCCQVDGNVMDIFSNPRCLQEALNRVC